MDRGRPWRSCTQPGCLPGRIGGPSRTPLEKKHGSFFYIGWLGIFGLFWHFLTWGGDGSHLAHPGCTQAGLADPPSPPREKRPRIFFPRVVRDSHLPQHPEGVCGRGFESHCLEQVSPGTVCLCWVRRGREAPGCPPWVKGQPLEPFCPARVDVSGPVRLTHCPQNREDAVG